jgi:hypothetical protein
MPSGREPPCGFRRGDALFLVENYAPLGDFFEAMNVALEKQKTRPGPHDCGGDPGKGEMREFF